MSENVNVDVREMSDNVRRVRFADGDGGSTDWHCALREPTTQLDSRATYLEQSIGEVALLRELEVYDSILSAMPQFRHACRLPVRKTPQLCQWKILWRPTSCCPRQWMLRPHCRHGRRSWLCLRPSPVGWIAARAEVRGRQWRPSQQ